MDAKRSREAVDGLLREADLLQTLAGLTLSSINPKALARVRAGSSTDPADVEAARLTEAGARALYAKSVRLHRRARAARHAPGLTIEVLHAATFAELASFGVSDAVLHLMVPAGDGLTPPDPLPGPPYGRRMNRTSPGRIPPAGRRRPVRHGRRAPANTHR
jgi:hypothetical protein